MRNTTERLSNSDLNWVLNGLTLRTLREKQDVLVSSETEAASSESVFQASGVGYTSAWPAGAVPSLLQNRMGVSIATETTSCAEQSNAWFAAFISKELRVRGLETYLKRIASEGYIQESTFHAAMAAWSELSQVTHNRLPVPDASAGPEGMLLLTWDRGAHHLELEFTPDTSPSFFYLDRKKPSGAWEFEYSRPLPLREKLFSAFGLFF